MKRKTAKLLLMCSCICVCLLAGCGKNTTKPETSENNQSISESSQSTSDAEESSETTEEYPKIVNIDQVLYYGTDEECMQVPRKAPDGSIKTFCPPEIMPDMPESANFGEEDEELPYMFLEDESLIVQINCQWMYFEKEGD